MTVTYEVAMKTGNISIYYTYAWWSYCLWRWVKKWGTTWIFRFGVILLNSQQSEVKGFPKRSAGITLRVYMTKKKSIWNIILAIRNRQENGIIKPRGKSKKGVKISFLNICCILITCFRFFSWCWTVKEISTYANGNIYVLSRTLVYSDKINIFSNLAYLVSTWVVVFFHF
jgi:hypothetical protein